MAVSVDPLYQAAAIPVKAGRICLVTSRSGKRWVVPKGCMERGKTPVQIALQEAWEEAGLVGVLDQDPVGTYMYEKWGNLYRVTVFRMHVTKVWGDWPERTQRKRGWFRPEKALSRIDNPGLRNALRAVMAAIPSETEG